MSITAAQRARFVSTSVTTASPATLLVMLYDRVVLDLQRAESAQRAGDRSSAHAALVHAQDVVAELTSCLDVDAWDGAPGLLSLYTYLTTELVAANTGGDPERTASCRLLVEPLRDAWREAAASLAGTAGAAAVGGTA